MKSIGIDTAVYLWQGTVDMRMGFDRLSAFVAEQMKRHVMSGGVYVFFSRCRSKVKIFYWDKDGYALWQKRLESGSYKVVKVNEEDLISAVDLEEILSGIELCRIKFRKKVEKGSHVFA